MGLFWFKHESFEMEIFVFFLSDHLSFSVHHFVDIAFPAKLERTNWLKSTNEWDLTAEQYTNSVLGLRDCRTKSKETSFGYEKPSIDAHPHSIQKPSSTTWAILLSQVVHRIKGEFVVFKER